MDDFRYPASCEHEERERKMRHRCRSLFGTVFIQVFKRPSLCSDIDALQLADTRREIELADVALHNPSIHRPNAIDEVVRRTGRPYHILSRSLRSSG